MNTQIEKTQRKTIRYWYIDGLPELAMGGFFLLLGVYFYIINVFKDNLIAGLLGGFFALIFIGGYYLSGRMVRHFKERITYPRTGYVAYKRDKTGNRRRILLAVLAASLAAALVALAGSQSMLGLDFVPALSGLCVGLGLGILGWRVGLARFYVLAGFNLLLGVSLTLAHVSSDISLAIFYSLDGLVLVILGAFILRAYLGSHPAPTEQGNEQ